LCTSDLGVLGGFFFGFFRGYKCCLDLLHPCIFFGVLVCAEWYNDFCMYTVERLHQWYICVHIMLDELDKMLDELKVNVA
jgi:hypothetical protein